MWLHRSGKQAQHLVMCAKDPTALRDGEEASIITMWTPPHTLCMCLQGTVSPTETQSKSTVRALAKFHP